MASIETILKRRNALLRRVAAEAKPFYMVPHGEHMAQATVYDDKGRPLYMVSSELMAQIKAELGDNG